MAGIAALVSRCGLLLALVALLASGCQRKTDPLVDLDGDAADSFEPRLRLIQSPSADPFFAVVGLTPSQQVDVAAMDAVDRATLLEVFTGDASDTPPMVGKVSVVQGFLHFEPRYPLRPGLRYRLVYHPSRLPSGDKTAEDLVEDFEIPEPPAQPPTVVAQVYPTAEQLPENLLKFYIHFSAPMSRGEAYQRLHLLDAEGHEVADPFLELGEELWDPRMRRFTLLFDPGRIKRGLKPREEVGPVLEEGKRYTLVVDREWLDASGQPLAAELTKKFETLPPDDVPVDTAAWKIDPPGAGSRDPLVVRFPEPLDHSMLDRVVKVADPSGQTVAGSIEITDRETCWRLTPELPWREGQYQLVADTTLEDLAGNSIGRAFDVDVFEKIETRITTKTASIPFTIVGP